MKLQKHRKEVPTDQIEPSSGANPSIFYSNCDSKCDVIASRLLGVLYSNSKFSRFGLRLVGHVPVQVTRYRSGSEKGNNSAFAMFVHAFINITSEMCGGKSTKLGFNLIIYMNNR